MLIFLLALAFPILLQANEAEKPAKKLNVLFIAVDDLRPELGCYGVKGIKSPNIDALAKRGLLFNRAYCQQAVCSPSRTSLLTGRRPDTTGIYNLEDHFRDKIPNVVTLPQYFKEHGYFCQSFGKIYHGGLDDPKSWSAPSVLAEVSRDSLLAHGLQGRNIKDWDDLTEGEGEANALICAAAQSTLSKPKKNKELKAAKGKGAPWSSPDVGDADLAEGEMTDKAIAAMQRVKDKPFFLAVGFRKPHLSFDAPQKYYDLYRLEDMKLAANPYPPKDVFPRAMSNWAELRAYQGMPKEGPVPEQQARELIRGYYAATSYTDAQVGRVLAALDRLGLRESTIIIFWGDHGWQLGEHGMWCKHTNFETSTHAPLIISVPGQKTAGAKTDALTEFVDIYPTLVQLAGLPECKGLEGTSFVPLIENPKQTWKTAAFSQYPRGKLMGRALRTDRYRFVEWAEQDKAPEGRELYDHQTDPDENFNLANQPQNQKLVEKLSNQLHAGWQKAVPPQ
jgi:iduronate 2-sulfatase